MGRVDIRDREELLFLLGEAAAYEHTVMCSYLYAMWSLKRPEEGLTERQGAAAERFRGELRRVVLEEMVHLALVCNLRSSLGGSAQFSRPDFPVPPGHFPSNIRFELTRFSPETLEHFMYLERPEGIELADGAGFVHPTHFERSVKTHLLTPTPHDYPSQGSLYHEIGRGIVQLADEMGQAELFCGHRMAQLSERHLGLAGVFCIDDVDTALRAIDEIVLRGEGAPVHNEHSHYARFRSMHEQLLELTAADPSVDLAWPAARNPWLHLGVPGPSHAVVTEELARDVVDLGNSVYALMLRTFAQVCSPHPLPGDLRVALAGVSAQLMRVLSCAGETAARLPLVPGSSTTAGLSLQLPRENGALVQVAAAKVLAERARELAESAETLLRRDRVAAIPAWGGVVAPLLAIARRLLELQVEYEAVLVQGALWAGGSVAPRPSRPPEPGEDINTAATPEITIAFDPVRCIHSRNCVLGAPRVFVANVEGAWLHPEEASVAELVEVAHRCPSGAITYRRMDGGPEEPAPEVNTLRVLENGPNALHADIEIVGKGTMRRATLCRCGRSKEKPFCDGAHGPARFMASGEPVVVAGDNLAARGGKLTVRPLPDGPNELRGNLELLSGTGRRLRQAESIRLCRCGASENKPYCDGTHVKIGFRSEPKA